MYIYVYMFIDMYTSIIGYLPRIEKDYVLFSSNKLDEINLVS